VKRATGTAWADAAAARATAATAKKSSKDRDEIIAKELKEHCGMNLHRRTVLSSHHTSRGLSVAVRSTDESSASVIGEQAIIPASCDFRHGRETSQPDAEKAEMRDQRLLRIPNFCILRRTDVIISSELGLQDDE
jgi:monoamine oxidase